MTRSPRIALEPEAYRALRIWGAMVGQEPSVLLSSLVLEHLSPEVRELLESRGSPLPGDLGSLLSDDKKKTRKPLHRNPEVLAKVDEMLNRYPNVTYKEIGDSVGYSRHTIGDYHKQKQKRSIPPA
jgi:hypothetical protein